MENLLFRICHRAQHGCRGEHCRHCGATLDCDECNNKVDCLGKPSINFCSKICADGWEEMVIKKEKLRSFLWKHPFKSLAIFGALVTATSCYILIFENLKTLPAIAASGLLLIALAGVLHLINSES